MKIDLKQLERAREYAIASINKNEQFLVITCADFSNNRPPSITIALQDENVLVASLAFLLAKIPGLREGFQNALKASVALHNER